MKKIMIALFVLTAAYAQAATVNWGSNGAAYFNATKFTGTAGNNGVGYLMVFEGNGGVVSQTMLDSAYAHWKGTTYNNVVAGPAASAFAGIMGGAYTIADGAAMGSSGLNLTDKTTYFANIFFTTRLAQDYMYQSGSILYDKTSPNWNGITLEFTAVTSIPSGTTWTAVPEPTSMALLALGAVAFGLRRRFKK